MTARLHLGQEARTIGSKGGAHGDNGQEVIGLVMEGRGSSLAIVLFSQRVRKGVFEIGGGSGKIALWVNGMESDQRNTVE